MGQAGMRVGADTLQRGRIILANWRAPGSRAPMPIYDDEADGLLLIGSRYASQAGQYRREPAQ